MGDQAWFTKDLGPATFQSPCYWATIGCSYVNPSVVVISPRTGADAYLLVGFQPSATLAGVSSVEIQMGINKTEWSDFNEVDDYTPDGLRPSSTLGSEPRSAPHVLPPNAPAPRHP